jgi:hypothetical protein
MLYSSSFYYYDDYYQSVLGALLSAHLLIIDPLQPFGELTIPNYDNELLDLAHDLASRLLPAFNHTPHGLPYPRVCSSNTIERSK